MRSPRLILAVALGIAWFGWLTLVSTTQLDATLAMDFDEGMFWSVAANLREGHTLYDEIYLNQPPLFVDAIAAWQSVFGGSLESARLMVALLSGVGVAAVAWFAGRSVAGRIGVLPAWLVAAGVTVILLAGSRRFPRLSMSLMQTLPAAMLAGVAIVVLICAVRRRSDRASGDGSSLTLAAKQGQSNERGEVVTGVWLFVGGMVLGLALSMKLTALPVVPAVIAWLLTARIPWRQRMMTVAVVGAGTMLAFLATLLPHLHVGPRVLFEQLLAPHLPPIPGLVTAPPVEPTASGGIGRLLGNAIEILTFLLEDLPLVATVVTAALLVETRKWASSLWTWTLAFTLLALLVADPIWSHYRVLIALPLAAMAGPLVVAALRHESLRRRQVMTGVVAVACLYSLGSIALSASSVQRKARQLVPDVLAEIEKTPGSVMGDDLAYATAARRTPFPEVAIVGQKRRPADAVWAGLIRDRRPAFVLLSRYQDYGPATEEVLAEAYDPVGAWEQEGVTGPARLYRLRERDPAE
jgi:4-amino-4-deoxy-L-arabinose transferase-like glycosyltransferase